MNNDDIKVFGLEPSWREVYDAARQFIATYDAEEIRRAGRKKRTGRSIPVVYLDPYPPMVEKLAAACNLALAADEFDVVAGEREFEENMDEENK